jgi:hypothetical protein
MRPIVSFLLLALTGILACAQAPRTATPPVCIVNGRFTLANGAPVPAVSSLGVVPDEVDGLTPAKLTEMAQRGVNSPPLFLYPDGHFTLHLPAPGRYRLLVDLFEHSMPAIPALMLQATPGTQDLTITLPDPLVTVPAGTRLFWTPKQAPFATRCLLVPASQPKMPIFGPRDSLLAFWYSPTPHTLALCTGAAPSRLLVKRQVRLSVLDVKDNPFYTGSFQPWQPRVSLLPLFPPLREPDEDQPVSRPAHATQPEFSRLRADRHPWPLTLWSGAYIVTAGTEGMHGKQDLAKIKCLLPVPIGVDGPTDIIVKDSGVTLPKPSTPADLPAPPLCTIAGQVLLADGRPMANTKIYLKSALIGRRDPNLARVNDLVVVSGATDADGRFTLANAPSGAVSLQTASSGDRWSSWSFLVPPTGLADCTLRALAKAQSFFLDYTTAGHTLIWWVPDQGAPWRIPSSGQNAYTNSEPQTTGYYWFLNTRTGAGKCPRYQPGVPFNGFDRTGNPLGIYLPLDLSQGYPGAITLAGTGDAAGMRMIITEPTWAPVALFNQMITQLDAVPPGTYTVTVETAGGPRTKTVTVSPTGGAVQFE